MKKILLATLFAGLFIFVWAQKAPKKPFYAPEGNCIAVVASIQDNTSPVVDNAEVLIVSDKIELKGKVKRYEVDSPFCFYEFDDVEFKDSIYIKVTHPDFYIYEAKIAAANFRGKHVALLKRKAAK